MIFKFLIFSICLKIALCYPNGAPIQACESLIPAHGQNQPNPEAMPVDIILESNVIRAGDLVSISLRTRNDTIFGPLLFRGFLVQARLAAPGVNVTGRVIGSFELTDGVQYVPCPTLSPNSVVTHTSNSDKAYLQLLWRAPTNIFENFVTVNFYYTIVWMFPVFWTNAISSPLVIENPSYMQNLADNL